MHKKVFYKSLPLLFREWKIDLKQALGNLLKVIPNKLYTILAKLKADSSKVAEVAENLERIEKEENKNCGTSRLRKRPNSSVPAFMKLYQPTTPRHQPYWKDFIKRVRNSSRSYRYKYNAIPWIDL